MINTQQSSDEAMSVLAEANGIKRKPDNWVIDYLYRERYGKDIDDETRERILCYMEEPMSR